MLDKLSVAFLIRLSIVGLVSWLFWFNGPLRQYFSLYRAVSQRGRNKKEMIDERKKSPNITQPHLLQAQQALAQL